MVLMRRMSRAMNILQRSCQTATKTCSTVQKRSQTAPNARSTSQNWNRTAPSRSCSTSRKSCGAEPRTLQTALGGCLTLTTSAAWPRMVGEGRSQDLRWGQPTTGRNS